MQNKAITGRFSKNERLAFTLIELMIVIAIIGILSGLSMGIAGYARRKAQEGKARGEIEKLQYVLQNYLMENGTYPVLLALPDLTNMFPADVDLIDPWKEDYVYVRTSASGFRLYSKGIDCKDGNNEDNADNIEAGR